MPHAPFRFVVPEGGARLDRLVADTSGAGRRAVRPWFAQGLVRVDGHVARGADVPAPGSDVTVEAGPSPEGSMRPVPTTAAGALAVVYEDARRIVVSKPAGLHCEQGRSAGSVAALLEQRYGDRSAIGERAAEGGLVHRLDRDTSGVLLAARDAREYGRLRRAFQEGRTRKQYLAIVAGRMEESLWIDTALARRSARMVAATPRDHGLPAETFVEPLESHEDWSLVLATLQSGAMHQIRVHLSLAGFPLVGDELYGGPLLPGCTREGQLLHALRIQVGDEMDVTAGAPGDFLAALALLRKTNG